MAPPRGGLRPGCADFGFDSRIQPERFPRRGGSRTARSDISDGSRAIEELIHTVICRHTIAAGRSRTTPTDEQRPLVHNANSAQRASVFRIPSDSALAPPRERLRRGCARLIFDSRIRPERFPRRGGSRTARSDISDGRRAIEELIHRVTGGYGIAAGRSRTTPTDQHRVPRPYANSAKRASFLTRYIVEVHLRIFLECPRNRKSETRSGFRSLLPPPLSRSAPPRWDGFSSADGSNSNAPGVAGSSSRSRPSCDEYSR